MIFPTNLTDYFISAPPQTIITYLASLNAFYIIAPEDVLISHSLERSALRYDSVASCHYCRQIPTLSSTKKSVPDLSVTLFSSRLSPVALASCRPSATLQPLRGDLQRQRSIAPMVRSTGAADLTYFTSSKSTSSAAPWLLLPPWLPAC